MKQMVKRGFALLMILVMCLSLIPVIGVTAHAADVDYVYSSDGKYIYNWGTRETPATFLSPNAEAFYSSGSASYEYFSSLSGGTDASSAPNSALYRELKEFMTEKQTYQTSYDATRPLFQYTDCENSGSPKTISSFYSGMAIGPDWDGGDTWNREHTWPNSKGDASGNGENDIMMLRPASMRENSGRGNKAYGESSSFYNPNGESGGKHDLRGDVSRIMLYVYTRWGNTEKMWGSDGVIESLDVLLKWMEEDPVDTWELGRNDSVESITGTRNVFVDYPELAFLLFGAEIPNDMTTPSGEAKNTVNCQHNYVAGTPVASTCTAKGYTPYTCTICQRSYKGDLKDMLPHNYVDGKCTVCQAVEVIVPEYVTSVATGKAYKLGLHSTDKSKDYYFTGSMSGYYGATSTEYASGIDVYVEATTGGYHLYFLNSSNVKQYINLVASGTYLNFTYGASATSVFVWDDAKDALRTTVGSETCYMGTYGTYVTMGVLKNSMLKDSDYIARLYTMGGGSGSGETPAVCTHSNTQVLAGKAATCTETGLTEGSKCTDCGKILTAQTEIAAKGHNYVNGTCSGCGKTEQAAAAQVTISFADKANRTVFTTSQQVWAQNGITITNDKGASTSAVADYGNPARFYKSSTLIVAYPGMTKIEFTCNTTSYATALKSSITSGTVSVSGKVVTVVLPATADSFTIVLSGGQVRMDSITVHAEVNTGCAHAKTEVLAGKAATCTETGLTEGSKCADCGEILVAQTEIAAKGHDYVNGTCSVCNQADPDFKPAVPAKATISFANKAQRTEFSTSKQVWVENGITITNEKGASTSSVADYANPARFYKSSTLIVAYPGMSKIEFTCNTSSYANALKSSITDGTVTVSGNVVTVTLPASADSFKIVLSGGQVRVDSITVYTAASVSCQHTWKDATCQAPKTCTLCGATDGEKAAHNYVNGKCTVCQAVEVIAPEYVTEVSVGKAYKLGLYSTDKNSAYYFTGVMSSYYGATATDYAKGIDVYLETATGGYRLYFLNASGAKQYINLVASGTHLNFTFGASATSVFTWDAAKNALRTTVGSETCYIGTYGTYVTMGTLKASMLKDTDYIARLYTMGGDSGSGETPAVCQHSNTKVEGAVAATCTAAGHTGKTVCADCGEIISEGNTIPAAGHKYVNGTCSVCGKADPSAPVESWTLVTNVSDLQVGDKIVIVAKGANKALGTTQNNNNRNSVNVTKSGDTVTIGSTVQIITLEAGKKANTFAFNVGSGYLYAASSSKNYLRTEKTLSNNSSWSITIASTGVATIKSQGTYTRNWLRYNSSNNPPLFACYGSGQADVAIYKLTVSAPACEHEWTEATCTTPKTCGLCGATDGNALGHGWINATCTTPKTCSVCNATEGSALGHSWINATCTAPKTCATCHITEGYANGHDYVNCVLTAPTCEKVGVIMNNCLDCGDRYNSPAPATGHNDGNADHNCDACSKVLSTCTDADNDHSCDYCLAVVSVCADADNNHKCDVCGAELTVCGDADNNHKCDVCGAELTVCGDADNNHKCDVCGAELTVCGDGNNNHKCDVCGAELTVCGDGNNNHKCDVCGAELTVCDDADNNHKCDLCGAELTVCDDADKNHNCDVCGAKLTDCTDSDTDYLCDICGASVGSAPVNPDPSDTEIPNEDVPMDSGEDVVEDIPDEDVPKAANPAVVGGIVTGGVAAAAAVGVVAVKIGAGAAAAGAAGAAAAGAAGAAGAGAAGTGAGAAKGKFLLKVLRKLFLRK